MEKVSYDLAKEEFNRWLDFKRVKPKVREDYKETIESLVENIQFGFLRIDEDCNLIQELIFPIEADIVTRELTYKPRVKVGEIHNALKGIKASDAHEMIKAIAAHLIGMPKGFLSNLDTEDYSICQNIALFFIPK